MVNKAEIIGNMLEATTDEETLGLIASFRKDPNVSNLEFVQALIFFRDTGGSDGG